MRKIAAIAFGLFGVALLSACTEARDFNAGQQVRGVVQRDALDTCRVLVVPYYSIDKMASFTAHIDGCVAKQP